MAIAQTTVGMCDTNRRPRVVIVGAGFGGLFATKELRNTDADIVLVDQHNYHLFQPLLYQVATAGLAPSDIAWPIRSILNAQENVTVLLDRVEDIDTASQDVITASRRLSFDYLVVATGVRHAYFGHGEWESVAPGLKTIEDATLIRRKVLVAFEQAEMVEDELERKRLLTFVVVGGGPTGVELAGTIAELALKTLAADFRRIDSRSAKIILLEAGQRLLPALSPDLSDYTLKALQRLGVEVRLNSAVTNCSVDGVSLSGLSIPSATVLWAAGVAASPAGRWLKTQTDKTGRVIVGERLSVAGAERIFVVGDTAAVSDQHGTTVPGIAPAAKQQGKYVAHVIHAAINKLPLPNPFHYKHSGNLATIGRKSAVVEFKRLSLRGFPAWCIWGLAHIYFLIGMRSPLFVSLSWIWQYVSYRRGARLITGNMYDDRPE